MSSKKTDVIPPKQYHVLGVVNDKGGSRKTSFLIFLIAILRMEGKHVRAFAIDDQGRVERLFPDIAQTIVLPDADTLSQSAMGDTAALAPFFDALTEPLSEGFILFEIGANLSERVSAALRASFVDSMIPNDTHIAILAMLDGADDTIALSARSARLMKAALPSADLLVVQPHPTLHIDPTSPMMSDVASGGFLEVLEPALRTRGPLVWPMMSSDIRFAFEAMRVNPLDMLQADPLDLGRAAHDPSRMTFDVSEQTLRWTGRKVRTEFHLYLAALMTETRRLLGFPNALD